MQQLHMVLGLYGNQNKQLTYSKIYCIVVVLLTTTGV